MTKWAFQREKYNPIITFVGIAHDVSLTTTLINESLEIIEFSKNYYSRLSKTPPDEFLEKTDFPVRLCFSLSFSTLSLTDRFYRDFIRNYLS